MVTEPHPGLGFCWTNVVTRQWTREFRTEASACRGKGQAIEAGVWRDREREEDCA